MKVIFTIDSLSHGGTEKSLADLIPHLSAHMEVVVCYLHKKEDLLELYQSLPCKIIYLPTPGINALLKGAKLLVQLLKNEKPDVVVSTLYEANLISRLACWQTGIPLVGTFVTDSYGPNRSAEFSGIRYLKYRYTWLLDRVTAGIPKAYITNGFYIGRSNAKALGIPDDKVKLVYRGRDTTLFPAWRKPVTSPFVFATIGRLFGGKGIAELVTAFANFEKKVPNSNLIIIGEGPQRGALEKQIQVENLQDKIVLKGNVMNGWQLLYDANCFVFPSHYEGFSGALIEAMLTGIPIIASDIPMNTEAISDNVTGHIFPVKNAAALAEKLYALYENYDDAMAMGSRARVDALNRFDINKVGLEYANCIKSIAAKFPVN